MAFTISLVERLALRKLELVSMALAATLTGPAGREQAAITQVLTDVLDRWDVEDAMAPRDIAGVKVGDVIEDQKGNLVTVKRLVGPEPGRDAGLIVDTSSGPMFWSMGIVEIQLGEGRWKHHKVKR